MQMDGLRGELERLFELRELFELSSLLLGVDPNEVGGTETKAAYARALTVRCAASGALEALCEAILAERPEAEVSLGPGRSSGFLDTPPLEEGQSFAGLTTLRLLGTGPNGTCWVAQNDDGLFRLKLLHPETQRDVRSLQRYLTLARIAGRVQDARLPRPLTVGQLADKNFTVSPLMEGLSLRRRLERHGPLAPTEAVGLIANVSQALSALHAVRQTHGNLKLSNIITNRAGDMQLQDAGLDALRSHRPANGLLEPLPLANAQILPPERLRGGQRAPTDDVYAIGVALYELISGRPPFTGTCFQDVAVRRLGERPQPPSALAPPGWISEDLDAFTLRLLAEDVASRPRDARGLSKEVARFASTPSVGEIAEPAEVAEAVTACLGNPDEADQLAQLEARTNAEGLAALYEALLKAAADPGRSASTPQRVAWLLRAGRGFESLGDQQSASDAFQLLVTLHPEQANHWDNYHAALRSQGRTTALIGSMKEQLERLVEAPERAELMAAIGDELLASPSEASEAAILFARAFCEQPSRTDFARRVEQTIAGDESLWQDVLATCGEAAHDLTRNQQDRVLLLEQTGSWYSEKLEKPELALPCFQAALQIDPARRPTLDRVASVFRQNQMWTELSDLLSQRGAASNSPTNARALKSEAAEILALRLDENDRAEAIYESVLSEDPSDARALRGLALLYQKTSEVQRLVPLLERQLAAAAGTERWELLCNLGEAYLSQPERVSDARRCFEDALSGSANHPRAIRGLEQTLRATGQFTELLERWLSELSASPVPRRQVELLLQIAEVYEREFLLPAEAATALERVLALEPTHTGALRALQRVYRNLERWPDLAGAYGREADLLEDPPHQGDLLMRQARVYAEHMGELSLAIKAYDKVRAIDPERSDASEALADLYEALGNSQDATTVLRSLADGADRDETRARYSLRAARLLEIEGAQDEAAEMYASVLDFDPKNRRAISALRDQYRARSDFRALLDVLRKDLDHAEGDRARADLAAEIAELELRQLGDPTAAEGTAQQALEWDPTNAAALCVLGDAAFDDGRHEDAARHYGQVLPRVRSLPPDAALRVLRRYLECESASEATRPQMLSAAKRWVELCPTERAPLEQAAALAFESGSWEQAYSLYQDFLDRHREELKSDALGEALYRLGESLRHCGDGARALKYFIEAEEQSPSATTPLRAQAAVHEERANWPELVQTLKRLLAVVDQAEQAQLWIRIGDLKLKLEDGEAGLEAYERAEQLAPGDRQLLAKLMPIYSEQKSWEKLVGVVDRLAEFVSEPRQKAKYLLTAAMVCARNLARKDDAIAYYKQILELDPDQQKALSEYVVLQIERGNPAAAEGALRNRLELSRERADTSGQLEMLDALYTLYSGTKGQLTAAVEVAEAARALEPDNPLHTQRLSDLYTRDPSQYLDKAVDLHMLRLQVRPDDSNAYRRLRRLYTEARQADAAWCLCRVLHLLKLAEAEETRFFERMRSSQPAPAQKALDESDWRDLVIHPSVDPHLSRVFELIEPVVVAARSQPLANLGYEEHLAIDPAQHPYPLGHLLHYAAGVMGFPTPPVFENHHETGGLLFLNSQPPSVVLGLSALQMKLPAQTAAFIAARHLTYYRRGFYVRHLLTSVQALKAWLFAAFRLSTPSFPVGPELESPVAEAYGALQRGLAPEARDQLLELVSLLLQSLPSVDLRRWVTGVDLTADRVGVLLANDLRSVTDIVKSIDDPSAPPREKRLQEVILYSISRQFFAVRQRLGIAIRER